MYYQKSMCLNHENNKQAAINSYNMLNIKVIKTEDCNHKREANYNQSFSQMEWKLSDYKTEAIYCPSSDTFN